MYVSFKILYKFLGFQLISGCFDEVVEVDKITSSPKHSSNTHNSLQLTTRDDIFSAFSEVSLSDDVYIYELLC